MHLLEAAMVRYGKMVNSSNISQDGKAPEASHGWTSLSGRGHPCDIPILFSCVWFLDTVDPADTAALVHN